MDKGRGKEIILALTFASAEQPTLGQPQFNVDPKAGTSQVLFPVVIPAGVDFSISAHVNESKIFVKKDGQSDEDLPKKPWTKDLCEQCGSPMRIVKGPMRTKCIKAGCEWCPSTIHQPIRMCTRCKLISIYWDKWIERRALAGRPDTGGCFCTTCKDQTGG